MMITAGRGSITPGDHPQPKSPVPQHSWPQTGTAQSMAAAECLLRTPCVPQGQVQILNSCYSQLSGLLSTSCQEVSGTPGTSGWFTTLWTPPGIARALPVALLHGLMVTFIQTVLAPHQNPSPTKQPILPRTEAIHQHCAGDAHTNSGSAHALWLNCYSYSSLASLQERHNTGLPDEVQEASPFLSHDS